MVITLSIQNTIAPPAGQGIAACSNLELGAVIDEAVKTGLFYPEQTDKIDRLKVETALLPPYDEAAQRLNRLLSVSRAPEMALNAIRPLFHAGDVVELRALDPANGRAQCLHGQLGQPEDEEALRTFIARNIGVRNLYFGANPRALSARGQTRAANAEVIVARRSIAFDLDLKDAPVVDPAWEKTRDELRALGPVLELETGNGFHIWFRVADVDANGLSASTSVLSTAYASLGADNVSDLPRVMRLPFTVNLPGRTKRARGNVPRFATPFTSGKGVPA